MGMNRRKPRKKITQEELVELLAKVSHKTWVKQRSRDKGELVESIPAEVTDHDRERARDTIDALKKVCRRRTLFFK